MDQLAVTSAKRHHRTSLLGGLLVAGGLAFAWFGCLAPLRDHGRWYREVREDIVALLRKRPPDVSKGQWEFAVGWTINLHANAGGMWSTVDPDWRPGFAAELRRRLQGPMSLADIDWIWDEYAAHTKYGPSYSDKYRPTRSEDFAHAEDGCFGFWVE